MNYREFQELLDGKGRELYRDMPWREDTRPYYVLVSELMLQQTQVARVLPKFTAFIARFPDVKSLADASLADVLKLWQGLGYNRRAKYLHEAAKMIVHDFGCEFPDSENEIMQLPGVGKNTCGAILAYSFNRPAIFIETNIRTVYIHHFFADDDKVSDAALRVKLEATIDPEYPREFYWALMDYGSWLKAQGIKNTAQSRHYKKQSTLKGSIREIRGRIVKALSEQGMSLEDLEKYVAGDERFQPALDALVAEKIITRQKHKIHLTK